MTSHEEELLQNKGLVLSLGVQIEFSAEFTYSS